MAEFLTSHDPRTRKPIGEVPTTPPAEVAEVVARSRKAFDAWSALSHRDRRYHLARLKRVILAEGDEIAGVVAAETGKAAADAYGYDVLTSLTVVDHYARRAEAYLRPRRAGSWPFLATRGWVEYRPRGVAGVISPWNYPFFLPMIPTAAALAAGCSVVLKPSELAPLTGQLIPRLVEEAGLPPDLVQVVQGGAEVGEALVGSGVDVVAFTGSTRVGRKVAAAAAERLIPAVLELGGKDPMIVLEDADLRQAARAAVWGSMLNAGQTCVAVERVYVVDAVYDRFLAELESAMDAVSAGGGDRRDVGPMIDSRQLEVVERHLADAVERGARVLRGGERVAGREGFYLTPALVVDGDHSMELFREETFGPVLPVVRVADQATAVAMANDSEYGIHASVWSRDRTKAAEVAGALGSGTVAINDVAVNWIVPGLPFAGTGASGWGVNFGPEGIRAFCHLKGVTAPRLPWPTTRILSGWFPRTRGIRYWKALGRLLYRW